VLARGIEDGIEELLALLPSPEHVHSP
jgi:hypothetical protein